MLEFYDGDLLIVDKSMDPRNFSTVIANVNEGLVVKTLSKGKKEFLPHFRDPKNILDKINLTENPEIVGLGSSHLCHTQTAVKRIKLL